MYVNKTAQTVTMLESWGNRKIDRIGAGKMLELKVLVVSLPWTQIMLHLIIR